MSSKLRILSLALCIALLAACLIPCSPAFAASKYEYYDSGDDEAAQAYGVNWFAQTFTTTSTHTATQIKLKLYRTGTPGTVTVSIRDTDGSSHPVNEDLASGTIDGDTCTADTGGDWYTFDLTPELSLADATKYAIVLRAVAGDGSNSIHWLDNSTGSLSNGNYESSTDSGSNWSASSAKDFMFEVWGNTTLEVIDVKVFSSVMQDGSWLFLIHYKCIVPPPYPGEVASEYFNIVLKDGATSIAQIKLPAWGYKPASLYLSPTVADTLTWGDSDIKISIEGNADQWASAPSYDYTLLPTDWLGADLFWLDEWVRDIAQDVETYYGIDVYTETVGDVTLPTGEGVLTQTGGDIFLLGIPGLDELRPHLFYVVVHELEAPTGERARTYEETTTWETEVGPHVASVLNTWGGLVNLDGYMFGGLALFAIYIGIVGIGLYKTGEPAIATALAIPMLAGAMYLRLIPFALMAIVGIILLIMTVWLIWLRST